MEELAIIVNQKRPNYNNWIRQYLKFWFHFPVFDGIEENPDSFLANGTIRYVGWVIKIVY